MQYGEPGMSSGVKSGRAFAYSSRRGCRLRASFIPAGLRRHTPISQTVSNPMEAMASHSSGGTPASVTGRLCLRLNSPSQTQVLIS